MVSHIPGIPWSVQPTKCYMNERGAASIKDWRRGPPPEPTRWQCHWFQDAVPLSTCCLFSFGLLLFVVSQLVTDFLESTYVPHNTAPLSTIMGHHQQPTTQSNQTKSNVVFSRPEFVVCGPFDPNRYVDPTQERQQMRWVERDDDAIGCSYFFIVFQFQYHPSWINRKLVKGYHIAIIFIKWTRRCMQCSRI